MRNGPYILVVAPKEYPGKKYRGRYCYKHSLVWWEATGEIVGVGQIIHHTNENKHDNRIENLELMTTNEHSSHHGGRVAARSVRLGVCPSCGNQFVQKKRPVQVFCSRRCIGLYNHAGRKKNAL